MPASVNTAALMGGIQQLLLKKLGAFDPNAGGGVAAFGTSVSAPVPVGAIAAHSDGSGTDTGLNTQGGSNGTIQPGTPGGTQGIQGGNTVAPTATATEQGTQLIPIVSPGGVSAPGTLPCASAPLGQLSSAARSCYNNALKGNPTLSGSVTVSITVGPAGDVRGASASGLQPVASCIQGAAYGVSFPCKVSGGSTATVQMTFSFVTQKK